MKVRAIAMTGTALVAVAALTGCSGGAGPASVASADASAVVGAQKAAARAAAALTAVPGGPCDRDAVMLQLGPAVGAVGTYVWKPLSRTHGTPAPGTLATSAKATAYAASRFTTVQSRVTGCPASIPLINALKAGASLAHAAHGQLARGTVNRETIAGLNSIGGTVVSQLASLGVSLPTRAPAVRTLG